MIRTNLAVHQKSLEGFFKRIRTALMSVEHLICYWRACKLLTFSHWVSEISIFCGRAAVRPVFIMPEKINYWFQVVFSASLFPLLGVTMKDWFICRQTPDTWETISLKWIELSYCNDNSEHFDTACAKASPCQCLLKCNNLRILPFFQ